ncbi:heat-inducible transcriptional repressor HrcA [Oceanidesulfovibrio marinus]|uniref:Heat-inducible transcription repressor HrcA n=1 Tax=Oceanidesulfovibrio marinus TaxID=370038 RepID=A0A6P1ZB13_9BACT|nr:heat-inducible transcriptional repressor HrcA [Oceanidesulfovibrio marinus]QJT10892.1 heat-inducible transcription repressor HrcA [Oceanidesulfovibrio marinus]TVM30507.1 heat-inducible transcription repressor HrcA [Oceanidesulfovibrio marinus]
MEELVQREIDVLKTIIEEYIATGAPVGSRMVSKKSGLSLSPASMRNVMADLTEKGYLAQPHTSAGRIPTPEAFRFYLGSQLMPHPLPPQLKDRIGQTLSGAGLDLKDILTEASRLASTMTNQICMIVAPSHDEARWKEIDFVLIKPGLVLAVLVLEGGTVQNKLIPVGEVYNQDDLVKFSNYLNEHFRGRSLSHARLLIHRELQSARRQIEALSRKALRLARSTFDEPTARDVIVDGATNLFAHAEFAEVEKMREIFSLLEERSRLLELLDKTIAHEGIKVTFCADVHMDQLEECSLVSSPYGEFGQPLGVVGVMGPVRMDYANVLPLVDCIAKTLTDMLKERF